MITIWDVAEARGVVKDEHGGVNGGEFHRVGLPFMGGCQTCGATLAAYNMFPSKTGYVQCKDDIHEEIGFKSVGEFEEWDKARMI